MVILFGLMKVIISIIRIIRIDNSVVLLIIIILLMVIIFYHFSIIIIIVVIIIMIIISIITTIIIIILGWKDGHFSTSINTNNPNSPNTITTPLYSYDVINKLIEKITNNELFPNLEKIILFGFSAGGQFLLRYSFLPSFNIQSLLNIQIKFVISDPSTYLYFDEKRPFSNNYNNGFGVPDETWISQWKV